VNESRIRQSCSPLHRPQAHVVPDHNDGRAHRCQDGRLKLIVCLCSFCHGGMHYGLALSRMTPIGLRNSPGEQRIAGQVAERWMGQAKPCRHPGLVCANVVDHRRLIVGRTEISDD
jgi:hypothetical protein